MTTLIQLTQNLLFHNASLLAQVEYSTEGTPPSPLSIIFGLLVALLLIVAMWKVFTKAGQPGWASIIPIYNLYIWCKIVGRPGWWIILLLIPFVNIIVGIVLCIDMAKSFGKGVGFGIGLALLGIIFWPILGFGSAQYQGPAASAGVAVVPPAQPA
jgi:cellulose synthase/poly-beta-1,6-N-acetylglucosamine synthase-like glycosyltransferase